jgi:TolB-like protein
LSSLFEELKRRNVFRVAIAYIAVAWLILQVADIVFDNIAAPAWLMQALMFFLVIGFPLAVLFAWAYEMTPEGIKKEKDVDRSQSITAQTGQKLNRTIIVVLLAAVGFLLADKFMLRDTVPDMTATDSSVAVLPFVAMSSGPDDEYFADGLTEEILNSLARIPQILVTARTSSFHFKGQDIPIPEIAEKLGVAHVVEGSIRREGDRLRVTAQLIRAADGFHLWSKNYDRETRETLGVQSDIAEQIAATLGVVLDDEQVARMQAVGIRNPEAFIAMQKGIEGFYAAHGKPNQNQLLKENNAWFEKTLELEPGVSDVYAFHADYYTHSLLTAIDSADPDEDELRMLYDRLVEDLDSAVRTAKNDSERSASSFELSILTGNWRGLPALFDAAVRDNKCRASGWMDAIGLAYGKADAFAQMSERLTKCDPFSYSGWRWLVTARIWAGNAAEAIETAHRAQTYARHVRIQQQMVLALIAARRIDDAEQVIARDIREEFDKAQLQLAIEAARGNLERSRELIGRLSQMENDGTALALVGYARIGDRDAANRHAARLDAMPLGFILLMMMPAGCYCGAPWDLENTPNFARLLEDAELPWPPASPIKWPLKDW